jgi:hypothetical protein
MRIAPTLAMGMLPLLALACAPVLPGVVLDDTAEDSDTDDSDTDDTAEEDYDLPLCINELMPSNDRALVLEDGSSPDWVELHNDGWDPVDLAGWTLRREAAGEGDESVEGVEHDLGENGVLERGEWLLLYADAGTTPGHLPYDLSSDGGSLLLQAPDRGGERLAFGHVETDFSVERETDCCDSDDCLSTVYVGTPGADNAP